MAREVHKLSDGFNTVGDLKAIWNWDPPRFEDLLNADMRNNWHPSITVMNGELVDVEVGEPSDDLVIPRMDPSDVAYINSIGPFVTYRTYNSVDGTWNNYNAVKGIIVPDPKQWDYDGWSEIVVPFRKLQVIA